MNQPQSLVQWDELDQTIHGLANLRRKELDYARSAQQAVQYDIENNLPPSMMHSRGIHQHIHMAIDPDRHPEKKPRLPGIKAISNMLEQRVNETLTELGLNTDFAPGFQENDLCRQTLDAAAEAAAWSCIDRYYTVL